MAKDYLSIPGLLLIYYFYFIIYYFIVNTKYFYLIATSVPAERVFSSASDIVTSDRIRLAADTIRAVICLKHWYRSGFLQ
jgi:hypothetical protein